MIFIESKKFRVPTRCLTGFSKPLYKIKSKNMEMQKNPAENFTTVEIDPVSGEYYVVIPQWICDEKGWYEGTEVNIEVDGNSLVITEVGQE